MMRARVETQGHVIIGEPNDLAFAVLSSAALAAPEFVVSMEPSGL